MDPISITALTASIGSILTIITGYMLKSRCTKIDICWGCLDCERKLRSSSSSREVERNEI